MAEQDPNVENTLTEIKRYLTMPGEALSMAEFKQFWDSCTDAEKEEFKRTPLPKSE